MQNWDHDASLMLLALAILAATWGCISIAQQFSYRRTLRKVLGKQSTKGARIPLPCFSKPSFRRPYHDFVAAHMATQAQTVLRCEAEYERGQSRRRGFSAYFNDAKDAVAEERDRFDTHRDVLLAYGFAVRRTPYDYAETTTVVAVTTAKAA